MAGALASDRDADSSLGSDPLLRLQGELALAVSYLRVVRPIVDEAMRLGASVPRDFSMTLERLDAWLAYWQDQEMTECAPPTSSVDRSS